MSSRILLLSDIHANYPALAAVMHQVREKHFDMVINGGDSTVYATFPNETLNWLRDHDVVSILGNTDIKVLRLLNGKKMKKPRKPDKRIMYSWTTEQLSPQNKKYLAAMPMRKKIEIEGHRIGIFHGSPVNDDEHLFNDTPTTRFQELSRKTDCNIVLVGHSHTPFHKRVNKVHFINPGSAGRMFDKNPAASYAIMKLAPDKVKVSFFRCAYDIEQVVSGIRKSLLPPIYEEMFRLGRKLN